MDVPEFEKAWKSEHAAIATVLEAIPKLDIASARGKERLLAAKEMILDHLRNEEQHLYPPLRKRAMDHQELQWILDVFAKDMDEVTRTVLSFFRKYEKNPSAVDIPADFGRMVAVLKDRISREENVLIKEYARLL